MGRHTAPSRRWRIWEHRSRHESDSRRGRQVVGIAAGLALALSSPALTAQAHGAGPDPLGAGGATSPAVTGEPTLSGDAIARLAIAQLGRSGTSMNTLGGYGFDASASMPDAWCAEFAAWVWGAAGSQQAGYAGGSAESGTPAASRGAPAAPVSTAGLDGWAGSFLSYGDAHGTFHATGPRVGDAVVSAFSEQVARASATGTLTATHDLTHVGIVVAVSATTVTVVNGDWGDGRGGPRLVRMSAFPLSGSAAGTWAPDLGQFIAGYIDPVAR
ncbi:MAG: hypothetical protein FWD85_03780 [Microbacteriaceae bacterium]|nr:hypothetical protein [Microbacteriaceae bacterium]MCL2794410.1 hypothetical protein [Microbacteriaceae bacterium]